MCDTQHHACNTDNENEFKLELFKACDYRSLILIKNALDKRPDFKRQLDFS